LLRGNLLRELLANRKLGPVTDDRRELRNETERNCGGCRIRHEQKQKPF
jgi:hypothetical protein